MTAYQARLEELLIKSTLTPGYYKPSPFMKSGDHVAVLHDGQPVYLAGESDCDLSTEEAKQLASNEMFQLALRKIGLLGEISYGVVSGASIYWKESYSAIVRSESGRYEDGIGTGDMIGVNLTDSEPLTVLMCVNDSIAKILSPECPELDNGVCLSLLASMSH